MVQESQLMKAKNKSKNATTLEVWRKEAAPGRRRKRVRKRRRTRGRPSPGPEAAADLPSLALSDVERQGTAADHARWTRKVISRSAAIVQREEDLAGRALVVSVIADSP